MMLFTKCHLGGKCHLYPVVQPIPISFHQRNGQNLLGLFSHQLIHAFSGFYCGTHLCIWIVRGYTHLERAQIPSHGSVLIHTGLYIGELECEFAVFLVLEHLQKCLL